MRTDELDYELPEALIAQRPAVPRDSSRLMVVDAATGDISHHVFHDLPTFLRPGDALVLNETKVLPARLAVRRSGGGAAELLFLGDLGDGTWEVLARPSRKLRSGMELSANGGGDLLRLIEPLGEGRWTVAVGDVHSLLERSGRMPLPPYIGETPAGAEGEYQTVYARVPGSAAAPTAGLHFTQRVLDGVARAGCAIEKVTLHVGTGTFSPVRTEDLADHPMHAERYHVPEETAKGVGEASRVLAVGTTATRTLEAWAASGELEGETDLFVYPGYRWRVVDALITNFHLPRSTLLALVMAFSGRELIREAYELAIRERYRFYSFGDAMLLLNGGRSRP